MEQTSSSAATSLPKMKFRRIHRHKAAKARASVLKSRVSELESKPATSQEHTGDTTAQHGTGQTRTGPGQDAPAGHMAQLLLPTAMLPGICFQRGRQRRRQRCRWKHSSSRIATPEWLASAALPAASAMKFEFCAGALDVPSFSRQQQQPPQVDISPPRC